LNYKYKQNAQNAGTGRQWFSWVLQANTKRVSTGESIIHKELTVCKIDFFAKGSLDAIVGGVDTDGELKTKAKGQD